jgi:oligopeptide transport system ATP-binding protein
MPWIHAADRNKPMTQQDSPLLKLDDLHVQFNTPEGTVYAVNGVSFDIHEGDAVAIVGESGCGKSVCMMSVLGLIPIPPGEIPVGEAIFEDVDLLSLSEKQLEKFRGQKIGMIFQDPMTSLNPVLTLGRQLTEALIRHYRLSTEEARSRAFELMHLVGISDPERRFNNYPHQFSGGMRQRVMIAMMLACNPKLLIADEPTTALDVTIQAQIVDLVLEIRKKIKMSLIWITHDLGVVANVADRVLVMYGGTIVEEADIDLLYEQPQHPYTIALLAALPKVNQRRAKRLKAIPGAPPVLMNPLTCCPFSPRCDFVVDRCFQERPMLEMVKPNQKVACFVNPHTGEPK